MRHDEQARRAAATLAELTGVARHDAVVVLGSGWDAAADVLGTPVVGCRCRSCPASSHRSPRATAAWSAPTRWTASRRCVYLGRTHLYEGHGPAPVAHPVRVAAAAGARLAVLTNASGGLRADWPPGTGALVADHLNLTFVSPLSGPQFVDLTDAWSPRLRAVARSADPTLVEAVYAQLRGPSVQTVAETAMLRTLGADLVGMSTVVGGHRRTSGRPRAAGTVGGHDARGHRRGAGPG